MNKTLCQHFLFGEIVWIIRQICLSLRHIFEENYM